MSSQPQNAASAEVTAIDTGARWPLLFLIGSGLVWLAVSSVLGLIAAMQLHSPAFHSDCAWLTHGRMAALRETTFVYGWAANAGMAIGLWILGRLGGACLRGLNWLWAGTVFWNVAVTVGLVGIATGDMTSFALLQLPRYVQPVLVLAYASMALAGVLAWHGRRRERMFASQWYAVAGLFVFPWLLTAAQMMLLWSPVRGVVQGITAAWYAEGLLAYWLAPCALAGAYYVVPKIVGRPLSSYEAAPLAFWILMIAGTWTAGRHLIGGPVPAWIPTLSVVGALLLLFHYLVVALNMKIVLTAGGTAANLVRFGVVAYLLHGVFGAIVSFRAVALHVQFTFVASALQQLALYGAVTTIFLGLIYYMVPRLTGRVWASSALAWANVVMVMIGVAGSVLALAVAGETQGKLLLDGKTSLAEIFQQVQPALMFNSAAHFVLLGASLILLVNFGRSICGCCAAEATETPEFFRPPAAAGEVAS